MSAAQSEQTRSAAATAREGRGLRRIGLVLHPTRDVEEPLQALLAWAQSADIDVRQIPFASEKRRVLDECPAADCELIVAIGGDGTTLSAIHNAVDAGRPVLGVACGSLGALATIGPHQLPEALEQFAAGQWIRRQLPALEMTAAEREPLQAFNDIVIARQAEGQVRVSALVDHVLFARFAGDGCIVSTAIGSSAYNLAAGGPLLPLGLDAFLLTPLPAHGGFRPPLVVRASSELELEVAVGHGGARVELDGQVRDFPGEQLAFRLVPDVAVVVAFEDQEPFVSCLRRRGIISDSPRILAEDERRAEHRRRR